MMARGASPTHAHCSPHDLRPGPVSGVVLLVLPERAKSAEERLPVHAQRLQRGAVDPKPGQRLLRGGLSALDQGAGISPEPVGLSGPITIGYLHGPAGPGENAQQVAPINIPIY